eukprot:366444-Chlamydomonas_euryale.AAC.17
MEASVSCPFSTAYLKTDYISALHTSAIKPQAVNDHRVCQKHPWGLLEESELEKQVQRHSVTVTHSTVTSQHNFCDSPKQSNGNVSQGWWHAVAKKSRADTGIEDQRDCTTNAGVIHDPAFLHKTLNRATYRRGSHSPQVATHVHTHHATCDTWHDMVKKERKKHTAQYSRSRRQHYWYQAVTLTRSLAGPTEWCECSTAPESSTIRRPGSGETSRTISPSCSTHSRPWGRAP